MYDIHILYIYTQGDTQSLIWLLKNASMNVFIPDSDNGLPLVQRRTAVA